MKPLLVLLLLAGPAFAADDAQTQTLRHALDVCLKQTSDANAASISQLAPLLTQIEALQKQVAELQEAAKAKK